MAWLTAATGLDLPSLLFCMAMVFVASVIRGFSGFGLSALVVSSISLVLPPAEIVPMTLLLEAAASLRMLPAVRHDLDWKIMGGLLAGAVPAVPAGAWLLASLPDAAMRGVISLLVLGASLMVWRGIVFSRPPGVAAHGATGLVSGGMFGAAAIGGLPVVVYMLAATIPAATTRAVLTLYLMLMGLYGAAVTGAFGLLTVESLWRVALFLPPLFVGVAIGGRKFASAGPDSYRRFTLLLLVLLALAGMARAAFG
ncbi:MAG: sulfite exporter TauE/SafE family protein [Alphaproteobacteria bacterium]|nr:sulfite exporter TauE/SafE family protein [Alphaproteobacteria bacterium]